MSCHPLTAAKEKHSREMMRTGEDAIGLLNLPYKGRCGPSTMPVASLTRVATSAAVMMTTMIEDIAIVGERMMTITTAASDGLGGLRSFEFAGRLGATTHSRGEGSGNTLLP